MKTVTVDELAKMLKTESEFLLILCQINDIDAGEGSSELTLAQTAVLTKAFKAEQQEVESVELPKPKQGVAVKESQKEKSKRKWGNKKAVNQGEPLRGQTYQKNTLPKAYNQKLSNGLFGAVCIGIVVLSLGSGLSYFQAQNQVRSEAQKIIQSDQAQIKKMAGGKGNKITAHKFF
ncbi:MULTISPECIES: hypothetical protein [Lactococcus]|uniref:hypothetical protein n=1 Tax=Lactococcus TaxID=1357 RepID=UPI001CC1E300|nr:MULTISPECIES: hypothetical protein [Lactococcus]